MAKIPAVVALGMFDGVHMGHRRLLLKAAELAQRLGAQPVAFTFTNNPQTLFGAAPPVLTLPEGWSLSRWSLRPSLRRAFFRS